MPAVLTFDASDVDYLVNRFTLAELREEVAGSELEANTSRVFGDHSLGFWTEYLSLAKLALDVRRWLDSSAKPRPSKGMVDVEVVKAQSDLVSVIGGYTQLRKTGARFTGRCPLHNDKFPSLVVYPDKQSWHCFGACNMGGDVIAFVMRAENLDFRGAVARLGGGA